MTTGRDNPTICQIILKPRHAGEVKTINYYLELARERIPTFASINLKDNKLNIQGLGYDGRCAFCRYFRRSLENRGLRFSSNCPFEVQDGTHAWQVKIGSAFFGRDFLEDEERYLIYLRRADNDPRDLEAQLALGVIHEYHGRFAPALACYWAAHEVDPGDTFIKERLQDILALLQKILVTAGRC